MKIPLISGLRNKSLSYNFFANRARPTALKCNYEYLVLALGEKTVVQEIVGCMVWMIRRLRKPRYWEMSARGYALHSVCP